MPLHMKSPNARSRHCPMGCYIERNAQSFEWFLTSTLLPESDNTSVRYCGWHVGQDSRQSRQTPANTAWQRKQCFPPTDQSKASTAHSRGPTGLFALPTLALSTLSLCKYAKAHKAKHTSSSCFAWTDRAIPAQRQGWALAHPCFSS